MRINNVVMILQENNRTEWPTCNDVVFAYTTSSSVPIETITASTLANPSELLAPCNAPQAL